MAVELHVYNRNRHYYLRSQEHMRKFDNCFLHVAIIGGGFSGVCLAAELLGSHSPSLSVTLIERDVPIGRGVAYSTRCAGHLLNVPAQNMSALAGDASHFVSWAQFHYDSAIGPGDFLPRRIYGRYVESVLHRAVKSNEHRFERKCDEAVAVMPLAEKVQVHLRSGSQIVADKIVFAMGNFPPAELRTPGLLQSSSRYISNPWLENALAVVENDKPVLLVGSGLTGVDVAISLRERGFCGKIQMLSRHGLLPQLHKPAQMWPAFIDDGCPGTARLLLRSVREEICQAEEQGGDWRAVIDSLRPVTQRIWRSLSIKERRRFLRHLRTHWDVHRHRIAPRIGEQLAAEINAGKLQTHAGRLVECAEREAGVDVRYRERETQQVLTLQVGCIINCTGPDSDFRRIDTPLVRDLIRRSLARPDSLSLGLDTADDGALLNAHGAASECLYAIGPLRKGNLWESTAVPEIRKQAAELALQLVAGSLPASTESLQHQELTA
jgi:uncharacterized NAD(P)/FAD-binding protein YdhS